MEIKILGTGCPKCNLLFNEAQKAINNSGVDANLIKVENIDDIIAYGIMVTPALVFDNEVKSSGSVPKANQIEEWIKDYIK